MNLDKTQVARRHLGTALVLFLDDLDPVSVHSLACAGCEVAEHLTRKAGAKEDVAGLDCFRSKRFRSHG